MQLSNCYSQFVVYPSTTQYLYKYIPTPTYIFIIVVIYVHMCIFFKRNRLDGSG